MTHEDRFAAIAADPKTKARALSRAGGEFEEANAILDREGYGWTRGLRKGIVALVKADPSGPESGSAVFTVTFNDGIPKVGMRWQGSVKEGAAREE